MELRAVRIGLFSAVLLMMVGAEDVNAQPIQGLGASELEAAVGGGNQVESEVAEVYCDYSLTPNDVPRKATLEFSVAANVSDYNYGFGGVLHYTCSCTVTPTHCRYAATSTVYDIRPDGTRVVSADQCTPGRIVAMRNLGPRGEWACPTETRHIQVGANEITDFKWTATLYGSYAESLYSELVKLGTESGQDVQVMVAQTMCVEGCDEIASVRQAAQSFARCNGAEPTSFIRAPAFCQKPN